MKKIITLVFCLPFFACHSITSWQLESTISIEGINPIGIAKTKEGIWLSDGDHNRLVLIDEKGSIVRAIDSLDRPMHISGNSRLLIPLYGEDLILDYNTFSVNQKKVNTIKVPYALDAPAGVWRNKNEIAIADFYNNRVLFGVNEKWISIGGKGKTNGKFNYPTDIQITENFIWVADAYNHRVQLFDKKGAFLKAIGVDQKMNAATGIFVSETALFVTDFENDRVLVFDHDGALQQEISENIEKPTDVLLVGEHLYCINYRNEILNVFVKK